MAEICYCKYCGGDSGAWSENIVKRGDNEVIKITCSCGHFVGWKTIKTEEELREDHAKRQKKYIEKIKNEIPEEYEIYLEKKRKAKDQKTSTMSDEEREEYLRKAREYQRMYRQKKKTQNQLCQSVNG